MSLLEGHTMVAYRDSLFVFGGRDNVTGTLLNTVWAMTIEDIAKAKEQRPEESARVVAPYERRMAPADRADQEAEPHLYDRDPLTGNATSVAPPKKDRISVADQREQAEKEAFAAAFTNPMPVVVPKALSCTGHVPPPRCYHQSALRGQFMLVTGGITASDPAGGRDGGPVTDDTYMRSDMVLWALNLDTLTWNRYYLPGGTSPTPLFNGAPLPRCHATLVSTPDAALLYGGFPTDGNAPPAPNHWSVFEVTDDAKARAIPSAGEAPTMWGHSATFCHGCLFVFGGVETTSMSEVNTLAVYSFDEHRWRWADFALAPEPRALHSCVLDGTRMLVFGGFSGRPDRQQFPQLGDLWRFCMNSGLWEEVRASGDIPAARSGHAAAMHGGIMYVVGGLEGNASRLAPLSTMAAFDSAASTWSTFRIIFDGSASAQGTTLTNAPTFGAADPGSPEELAKRLGVDQSPPAVWQSLQASASNGVQGRSNDDASPRTIAEWKAQKQQGFLGGSEPLPGAVDGAGSRPTFGSGNPPPQALRSPEPPQPNNTANKNAGASASPTRSSPPQQKSEFDAYMANALSMVRSPASAGNPSAARRSAPRGAADASLKTPSPLGGGRPPSSMEIPSATGAARDDSFSVGGPDLNTLLASPPKQQYGDEYEPESPTNRASAQQHRQPGQRGSASPSSSYDPPYRRQWGVEGLGSQQQPPPPRTEDPKVRDFMGRLREQEERAAYARADTSRDIAQWREENAARSRSRAHPHTDPRAPADVYEPYATSGDDTADSGGAPDHGTAMSQADFMARLARQKQAAGDSYALAGGKWWEGTAPDGRRRATAEEGALAAPGARPAREQRRSGSRRTSPRRRGDAPSRTPPTGRGAGGAELDADEHSPHQSIASPEPGTRGYMRFVPTTVDPSDAEGGRGHPAQGSREPQQATARAPNADADADDLPRWATSASKPRQHSVTSVRYGDSEAYDNVAGFVGRKQTPSRVSTNLSATPSRFTGARSVRDDFEPSPIAGGGGGGGGGGGQHDAAGSPAPASRLSAFSPPSAGTPGQRPTATDFRQRY